MTLDTQAWRQPWGIDNTATYSYRGVGAHVLGYATEMQYEGDYLECDDENCDHQMSELCWSEGEWSESVDLDNVSVVWIGDDKVHVVDVWDDQLQLLADDVEVCSCGQIGCFAQ